MTAPFELNAQELSELGMREAEFAVYGHLPVMISAQGLKKTMGKCDGNTGITMLTDRLGNQFPVKNVCGECFNVIYNTSPLYLGMNREEIQRLAPPMLRIQFSIETEEQTRLITTQLMKAFSEENGQSAPEFVYTQGHFKRGVL